MLRKLVVLMLAVTLFSFLPVLSLAETENSARSDAGQSKTPLAKGAMAEVDASADEEPYIIGLGDVLDVSVWKDEALTRSCVVRPDGAISFPLIGDMQAAGKTTSQLKKEIEKKLEKYVPDPILSLEVKQVNSMIIYVIGKVNAPGRFVINSDIDVLQALATAGGVNVYAKRNQIKIFREGKSETTIFPFQYDEVVDGRRLEQNIRLKRGDVVVVP